MDKSDNLVEKFIESKIEYYKLISSGMFWEFYPGLTGVWVVDMSEWYSIYKELDRIRNEDKT